MPPHWAAFSAGLHRLWDGLVGEASLDDLLWGRVSSCSFIIPGPDTLGPLEDKSSALLSALQTDQEISPRITEGFAQTCMLASGGA